ncbi:hypothetical protein DFH06DRAFT_309747 [Mycena polygramma]|nr:hypothetical protein DFH06DRAFT_309747 [Mycena polygramma]
MNQSTRLLNPRDLRPLLAGRALPGPPRRTRRRPLPHTLHPAARCYIYFPTDAVSLHAGGPLRIKGPTPLAAFNSLLHRHPIQAHPCARVFVGTFSSSFIPSATTSVYRHHRLPPVYCITHFTSPFLPILLRATSYHIPFLFPPSPTRHDSSRVTTCLISFTVSGFRSDLRICCPPSLVTGEGVRRGAGGWFGCTCRECTCGTRNNRILCV